jgi:hypothetical protein
MGIRLTTLAICEECPFFEARTVKFESDNIVCSTEVLCETYNQCKRAFDKGVRVAEQISQAGGEEDDRINN